MLLKEPVIIAIITFAVLFYGIRYLIHRAEREEEIAIELTGSMDSLDVMIKSVDPDTIRYMR